MPNLNIEERKILWDKLQRGDVTRIARTLNISTRSVYNVLNGVTNTERIQKAIEVLAKQREQEEQILLISLQNSITQPIINNAKIANTAAE